MMASIELRIEQLESPAGYCDEPTVFVCLNCPGETTEARLLPLSQAARTSTGFQG